MRKAINIIIMMIIFLTLISTISYSATNVELALSSTSHKLHADDTAVFTLKFDNMQEVKKSINVVKAKLEYDKDIFEEIKEIDFKAVNGWEGLQYNQNTNEFAIYKKAGTTSKEDIVEISLKVKEEIKADITNFKVTDIELSEGKEDIIVKDGNKTELKVDIIEEQEPGGNNPEDNNSEDNNQENNNLGGDNQEDNNPGDNNQEDNKPQDENTMPGRLPQTGKNYMLLFIVLAVEVVLSVNAVHFGRKIFKSKKQKMIIIIILASILMIQFVGTVYGAVKYFSQKGELNGDGAVNYADVNLLVSHLVHIKSLEEGKSEEEAEIVLQNADMNNDGKITVTDLSFLIKKIENRLDYEVIMSQINVSNFYPEKNEEITLSFDAEANYEAIIKSITMNGREYELLRNEANQNLYEIKVNVGNTSGVKEYKFEKATLTNGRTVKVDSFVKVDVLKSMPEVINWRQSEDIEKSELNLSFDIKDEDKAFTSGTYRIIDKQDNTENVEGLSGENCIKAGELTAGSNTINVKVEENKNYQVVMCIIYNLDTDTLENEKDNQGSQTEIEDICLVVDYEFKLSDIKTYKYKEGQAEESIKFGIGEYITLKFNSTNKTTCIPKEAVINGKTYELAQEENTYTAIVDGFDTIGENIIKIESVILSNGKVIDVSNLEGNKEIEIKVIKNSPNIVRFRANEDKENNKLNSNIYIKDTDNSISKFVIKLYAEKNGIESELANVNLTDRLIESNIVKEESDEEIVNAYYINTLFDISKINMVDNYKVEIFASYSLDGKNVIADVLLLEEEIEASPVVQIENVEASKEHVEKDENITLNYKIETNKEDKEITHIIVNNLQCIATRHEDNDENVTYSVTLPSGKEAGIVDLHTTEFIFEGNIRAQVDNHLEVDVLRDKPTSEAFLQTDDIIGQSVTLTARIVDPDKAFISGSADLVKNSTKEVVATKEFDAEHITFTIENVELDTEYTLVSKMTYARDDKKIEEETNEYYVQDEVFRERPIQLIADYELSISNLKTYRGDKQTVYFERGEEATISFDSTNKTKFYPVKAIINITDDTGKEYEKECELEKTENNYKTKIPVISTPGPKTVTIKKLILSNTKELEVNQNNVTRVGVLKLRPTITDFGYEEDEESKNIHVSFSVNDTEETITGGKIIILDENKDKVKEETFSRNSNGITFPKGIGEEYEIKILADYDLDSNQITTGHNEYKNQNLLTEIINVSTKRLFEVKDIIGISVYKAGSEKEVTSISETEIADKNNLKNYIVKVKTKAMPTFYAEVEDCEIVDNKLNFILNYDNVIQYQNGKKQSKLKVTYGEMIDGMANNKSIETLISEIETDPTQTVTLTQNYDASYLKTTGNAVINTIFRGTLDGNGYKITGLNKP
ncbi:MAG: hypothetical protein HFJ50_01510, partial [Clostridia bacterium]|nr:hypothetical protein [Clostridia bacterium]